MATVALHPVVERVTARIAGRSRDTRAAYLARMDAARGEGPYRHKLSCGNLAHGFAAAGQDKQLAQQLGKDKITEGLHLAGQGFSATFWVASILILLTLIPAFLLPRKAGEAVAPADDPAEAPMLMH